ncbi:MAG: hypothetical protein MJY96_09185 [Bacteroidaceae bacterium]|nr:hypothetical protein [Bacteroidaceae bacterium]
MKKFATLFCALALVFGASSAQTAHKALAPQRVSRAVEQVQKVQLESHKTAAAAQLKSVQAMTPNLSAEKALKVNNQKPQATVIRSNKLNKAQAPIARRSALNAKSVVKSAPGTAITIGDFSANTYEGEYYVILTDAASSAQFIFDIDISANPFELGKTYTIADMVEGYTGIGDAEDWYAWTIVTDASYTETKDQDGLTHVVASMTDEDGNVYDLTYDQPEPQDIDVTAVDWNYDAEYCDVYVFSETTTYLFELNEDLVLGKDYTYADMVHSWTCTLDAYGYPDITATDATLTVTQDEKGLTHIVATMVLSGSTHKITFDEKAFEPSGKKINVEGTDLNGRYMSYYGFYLYTATWGDYTVQLAFDANEEKAAYTNDEFIANYGLIYSDTEQIQLLKLASDNITITNTETTKTLTGSIYAKNGDEYVLNLVYEKPAAKEININVANADLTNKSTIGFWTIAGQTADKNNSFSIYFISKALQGTFTDVNQFDSYSTWVSDKSSGTNVYYENLSDINLTSVIDGDSLKITGTMSLADSKGNPATATVYITTPFAQEWGEWEDFAPFGLNTGKYSFSAAASGTQTNVPVQVRKDNTGFKQYKFIGWGKQVLTAAGVDLIVDMAPDYSCTVAEQNTGAYQSAYSEYIMASDLATYSGQDFPSAYDPETGTFDLAMVYYISLGNFGYGYETMVMDKTITERDTVDIKSTALSYNDSYIESNGVVIYYASDVEGYSLFRVTSNNATSVDGTFSWADGTINDPNSYFQTTGSSTKKYFQDGEFTVVTNNKDIALTGWMIGADEIYYRLDMSYTAPTTRDTVNFSGNSITISEIADQTTGKQTGWFYEVADATAGYEFLIQSTVASTKFGTFSYEDKTLGRNYYNIFTPSGDRMQFTDGYITVTEQPDGSITLYGELIGEDEKVYVLNFVQAAGVLNYDTDAPFDATFAYNEMEASIDNGVIGIYATNDENLKIGLELYADAEATEIPAGTYVISDTQEAGTALKSVGVAGGYLTECWAGTRSASGSINDCWFLVEGTVTLSYDEYNKLRVDVDAKNSYGQDVTATVKYERLQAKDTVAVNDASLSLIEDYMEKYGIVNFYCEGAEHAFDLYAYADTIYGDFAENIDYEDCGYYSIDGSSYSILDVYELNVSAEGKNMTLKAQILASDTVLYDITATGYYGAFDFDTNADFNAEFSTENMTTKTITRSKKSCKIISAVNEAGDSVSILFRASQIVAGTYEINYTESVNTVIASDGDTFENVSLAVRSKDGGEPDIWFMVSGTVTIDELGNISVNALNSYDKAIKFTINVPEPEYYLYNYYYGKYLGWNGSSTDKNKIAMMDESDRMAVTVTLTDADNKRFTTSVTATDDKAMYLSMGSGFNFHSGSPYAGEQDNGYWYKVKDITASSIEAEKVSEIEEGEFYIIVHSYNGYCALGGSVTDTDGNGKMRILGYKLDSADDMITLDRSDILPYVYRYVTADTPAMDPATSVKPVMQKNDDSIFNVAGQRTLNPSKGNIYIINGKKIMFE